MTGSELRKLRRQQGLCCQCGAVAFGKSRCPNCLRRAAESRRRYVARMTPDERERMVAKELQRRKMAKAMEIEIRHNKYLEEVARMQATEPINVKAKLTGMAKAFLKEG